MKIMTHLIMIMVSCGLATPTFAQAIGGYIDANVTIFVVSGSTLLKSSASVSYLHEADMVACTGDNCRYELSGNHRIIQRGYTVAGITFRTSRWQYRGSLPTRGVENECYFAQTDDMRYKYLNPPPDWGTNGQPYQLAYLSDQQSEERCVPPLADAVPSPSLPQTPIIISLSGQYDLTSVSGGVRFDINADAHKEQVAWTAPNSDLAFLAQDRNGNGLIDSGAELFGEYTRLSNGTNASNGFNAVADLDSNLDGWVDSGDPSWQTLLLWFDRDHDGLSTPEELLAIGSTDVLAVSTQYRWSGRKDKFGNEFRYKGEVELSSGKRACYDVFLITTPYQ